MAKVVNALRERITRRASMGLNIGQQLTRLEQEFGMTPSARTRIEVTDQTMHKDSNKSRFFNRG